MPDRSTRRDWLRGSLAAMSAAALSGGLSAAAPPQRNGKHHFKLSLAAYSFNRFLTKAWTPEQLADAKFTLEQFIDFCAEQNLDGCELTAYYFPKEITTEYLLSLKERAFRLGLDISGTAIGNNFCVTDPAERAKQLEMTRQWIDYSSILGAPVIRIFAGTAAKGDTEDQARERCVSAINESLQYAATKGVCLALENHGGITATPEQLLKIVEAVEPSPWFGVNFDGGNFRTEDPYADLAKIAPYSINSQLKVEMYPGGKKEPADLARVVQILKEAHYRGFVTLEYEAAEDPHTAIPVHIAELRKLLNS
ncbi:MAG: sugar phosphate isomerase/epimerase family protein [Planctomycetaceae bacterium]|nr:sugar phosphate isomerase/epimerase family protein [Planctomycetaceae bacterium]